VTGPVSFAILGPLEVRVGEQVVRVRGVRPQAVLAALLLRPAGASADELIDLIWGEDPTPSAKTAVQVQVSKLRKLFAQVGVGEILGSIPGGYRLEVDPDHLDVSRFDRLVADGRRALADGDPARAAGAFEAARSLWRGPPLTGIELAGLPPGETTELETRAEDLGALRIEADLALGNYREAAAEAEALAAARPLDERAAVLAATALAGAGRASDALAVISGLRRSLSTEFGIEPGPAIAALEHAILAADPSVVLSEDDEDGTTVREGRRSISVVTARAVVTGSDPELRRAAGAALVATAAAAAEEFGGEVLDAPVGRLLLAFGLREAHEDDAVRATRAASAFAEKGHRVGVATGEVLAVERGEERTLLSTDPIDLADELARRARPGEVLLDQGTVRLARGAVGTEPTEIVLLDDLGAPGTAFRLSSIPSGTTGPRVSAPLVGREEELGILRETLARTVRDRTVRLVTVIGPAGIGKSRLLAEFLVDAGLGRTEATLGGGLDLTSVVPAAACPVGRCPPYGHDVTYWPVAEVIRDLAQIAESDSARMARTRLGEMLAKEEDRDFLVEQVASVLGIADADPAPDELFWAIRRFLEAAAAERPLVVTIEDAHWAQETLLDLLEYVAGTARDVPLLLVANARPELVERRPSWGGGRVEGVNLWLDPLSDPSTAALLGRLLGSTSLAPEVGDRLVGAAEGNPLFLEELVQMLVDDGYLRSEEGTWVAAPGVDLGDVPLPPTVRALLDARLDRLPPGSRAALEAAAVVGRDFTFQDLRDLRPDEDPDELLESLGDLTTRDLIELRRVTRGSGRAYRFRHILLRDAAYNASSKSARARDHERYGDALGLGSGDRVGEVEEVLGYHLEAALRLRRELGGEPDHILSLGRRAAFRLGSAGRRALGRDDMAAAASLCGRALDCLRADDARIAELAWLRSIALHHLGRFDEARAAIDLGLRVAESTKTADPAMAWRLRLQAASIGVYEDPSSHPSDEILRLGRDAIAAFEASDDAGGLSFAYRMLGEALAWVGRFEEASEAYRHHLEYLGIADDPAALPAPTVVTSLHGTMPLGVFIETVREVLDAKPRRPPEALMRLGLALAMAGDAEAAHEILDEGIQRAREVGGEFRLSDANVHLGAALLYLGDDDGARAALEEATQTLARIGEQGVRSTGLALLAGAYHRLGRDDEAMAATLESEAITAEDDPASRMAWRGVRAKVLAGRGDLDEALRLAREAVEVADGTELLAMAGQAHLDLAAVLEAAGEPSAAQDQRRIATELFDRKGVEAELARLRVDPLSEPPPALGR
jgi:DNA-binding SARP family transcriptional activator/tetratricopeptide (TPR) repeat protein